MNGTGPQCKCHIICLYESHIAVNRVPSNENARTTTSLLNHRHAILAKLYSSNFPDPDGGSHPLGSNLAFEAAYSTLMNRSWLFLTQTATQCLLFLGLLTYAIVMDRLADLFSPVPDDVVSCA